MNPRVILAGGSGFLGNFLTEELIEQGYDVVTLTRSPKSDANHMQYIQWDGRTVGAWAEMLEDAAAVVNLAGKNVNCRYTPENQREILDSRIDSVNALGAAILQCETPPQVFIQASSLAIYGDTRQVCDEDAPLGEGFSADVCVQWEGAFNLLRLPDTRKVLLRIGFALAPGDGALGELEKLTRRFLGGTIGSGEQYISWIHIDDLNRMFLWALGRDDVDGTFNATGPQPVTNEVFMRSLRKALGRSWGLSSPEWAVRFGARLMGTEASLALTGRRCVPARFEKLDFPFEHPDLDKALADLLV